MSDPPRRTLAGILDLTPAGEDRWVAPTPGEGPPRLFGGQVAAQALAAACKTVDADRPPHSLHGYFIRPGRPDSVLELVVERTRDGRSFATRHVTAVQEGNAIFNLTASFHGGEEGIDWQLPGPGLEPPPDNERAPRPERPFWFTNPFEIRPVQPPTDDPWPPHPCWVRLIEELPTDQASQLCALTFISDMGVVGSARAPHDRRPSSLASLDHAVWFHRPVDMSEWHLFSVDPVSNFGARGLARGTIHAADGRLVASIAQEGLIRPGAPDWAPPGRRR
jgi:acyl-CoA thioesterase-2